MNFNREQSLINIYSMNNIIMSLSDDDLIGVWMMYGVPDGCDTLDDIEDIYGDYDNEELMERYEELTHLFARIVKSAVKDSYVMWTYIGQKIEKKGE